MFTLWPFKGEKKIAFSALVFYLCKDTERRKEMGNKILDSTKEFGFSLSVPPFSHHPSNA